jgi:hypothetical protein
MLKFILSESLNIVYCFTICASLFLVIFNSSLQSLYQLSFNLFCIKIYGQIILISTLLSFVFTADHNCLSFKLTFDSFLNIPTTLNVHIFSFCHDLKQYRIVFKAIFSIRFSVVA